MYSEFEFGWRVGIAYPIKHNHFVLFGERWEKLVYPVYDSGLW